MFALHEITRIRLCRAAFVVFCLLPTGAVVAWCAAIHMPSYLRAHERAVAAALGMRTQIRGVSSPRPGVTLYQSVELRDPETAQLLAQLPYVELQADGDVTLVTLPYPAVLNGTRLEAFWQLALAQLQQTHSERRIRIESRNLTFHLDNNADQTFNDVEIDLDNAPDQSRLAMTFRHAIGGQRAADSANFIWTRQREAETTSNAFQFSTGSSPLPCSLIDSLLPGIKGLGKGCTFQGELSGTLTASDWKSSLKGVLANVDLDGFFRDRFRHRLSGAGTIQLTLVEIENGRIISAAGQLLAGPGVISRSLIHAAQSNMRFSASPAAISGRENELLYGRLGLAFDVNGAGLVVRGACPDSPGVILTDKQGAALVQQGSAARQTSLNLLRTLVPNAEFQVPAARETDWLSHFLPVPSVNPNSVREDQAPQARTRGVLKR